jgi:four helix bundle protein
LRKAAGPQVEPFARFLQMAMNSASELDYHLLLARDLKMLNPERDDSLRSSVTEIKRMLAPFIGKLRAFS